MKKALLLVFAATSTAANAGIVWVPTSIGVPTMGEMAVAALAVALGVIGARFIKRK